MRTYVVLTLGLCFTTLGWSAFGVQTFTIEDHSWLTTNHEKGVCALYGVCGHRKDQSGLDCPDNQPGSALDGRALQKLQDICPQLATEHGPDGKYCCTEEQIDTLSHQIQQASTLLIGCPACDHNFKHFFCTLTCHPDQSTFVNVTDVQLSADTNETAVAQASYYVADAFGTTFYNSCKDVVYGLLNIKAMLLVGGGAQNFQQWFDFLGLIKDKQPTRIGAPFQMDFPGEHNTPAGMAAMNASIPACWDSAFKCSCGDCPDAPTCIPPPPPPPPEPYGCTALGLGPNSLSCLDLSLLLLYILFLSGLVWAAVHWRVFAHTLSHSQFDDAAADSFPLLESDEAGVDGSMEEGINGDEKAYSPVEQWLRPVFYKLGVYCGEQPYRVLAVCLLVIGVLCLGLLRFKVETNPQRLWVGAGSLAAKEKAQYEESFGAFWRIEQLLISTTPESQPSYKKAASGLPPIVAKDRTHDHIKWLFQVQAEVDALSAPYTDSVTGQTGNATLSSICFKPLGGACAIESVLQYWQMDPKIYALGRLSPDFCFGHWSTQCRSAFESPIDPHTVLGGFPTDSSFRSFAQDATSFVVTYPVDSSPANRDAALAWEAAFLELAQTRLKHLAAEANLKLSFSSERSVEDELARETASDSATVAVSYLVMLLYIALALGTIPAGSSSWAVLVYSRVGVGLTGVLIVGLSVLAALGICSLFGMWATLIILEVIPFLVLAVGVDNMFILAHALQQQNPRLPIPERLGRALAGAGPSITLAAACEALAFGLGGLTSMPAVRNFSLCAAVAVLLDYALQMTAFAARLALDCQRVQGGYTDCIPCIKLSPEQLQSDTAAALFEAEAADAPGTESMTRQTDMAAEAVPRSASTAALSTESPEVSPPHGAPLLQNGSEPLSVQSLTGRVKSFGQSSKIIAQRAMARVSGTAKGEGEAYGVTPCLHWYMEHVHAPALAKPVVQLVVLAAFVGLFVLSLATLPHVSRGLEQQVALPRDSYLQDYFTDLYEVLRVGPPLYFVVPNIHMDPQDPDINTICSVGGCNDTSFVNEVSAAAREPGRTFIADPPASWLDDFLSWLSPGLPHCCREDPQGQQCPPPDQFPCNTSASACADCATCFTTGSGPDPRVLPHHRPTLQQVQEKLPWFLKAVPSAECAKGGVGGYNNALQMDPADPTGIAGLCKGRVTASSFRTYYVPLNTQQNFIDAYQAIRDFTHATNKKLGIQMYSYSIFHVFFEQYLYVVQNSIWLLGGALIGVFAVCWLFTASVWASGIILLMVGMILMDLMGVMYLWGIQLNAVSVVNLTMALGIAVEFCAHIVHAFLVAAGSRQQRMATALQDMGASVLSGITITKFAGVLVLAFAKTQIFEVYFFRVYFGLVLLGASHALVLLPVLLSLFGPPQRQSVVQLA
ncbi:TPA: hypothetical protein ACH3X1_012171 [Trebouxia sp. C0004]